MSRTLAQASRFQDWGVVVMAVWMYLHAYICIIFLQKSDILDRIIEERDYYKKECQCMQSALTDVYLKNEVSNGYMASFLLGFVSRMKDIWEFSRNCLWFKALGLRVSDLNIGTWPWFKYGAKDNHSDKWQLGAKYKSCMFIWPLISRYILMYLAVYIGASDANHSMIEREREREIKRGWEKKI